MGGVISPPPPSPLPRPLQNVYIVPGSRLNDGNDSAILQSNCYLVIAEGRSMFNRGQGPTRAITKNLTDSRQLVPWTTRPMDNSPRRQLTPTFALLVR